MKFYLGLIFLLALSVFAQEQEGEHIRHMRLGCEKEKSALGCYNYANLLIINGKLEDAEKFRLKACKMGHEKSCKKEMWPTN